MKHSIDILKNNLLFQNIDPRDIESLLGCLQAKTSTFARHSTIFLAGNPARHVGIVLRGGAQILRTDIWGNRVLMAEVRSGDMFGESFACAGVDVLPVDVIATEECELMLLDYRRIITTCSSSCLFHNHLVDNMLQILAQKNLMLNQKIEVLAARSIREKLLVYLSAVAAAAGSRQFDIPFNRQELADYLSVDRSALSRELSQMQREGMLRYQKHHFEFKDHVLYE